MKYEKRDLISIERSPRRLKNMVGKLEKVHGDSPRGILGRG
jgi:hypothetical protein